MWVSLQLALPLFVLQVIAERRLHAAGDVPPNARFLGRRQLVLMFRYTHLLHHRRSYLFSRVRAGTDRLRVGVDVVKFLALPIGLS